MYRVCVFDVMLVCLSRNSANFCSGVVLVSSLRENTSGCGVCDDTLEFYVASVACGSLWRGAGLDAREEMASRHCVGGARFFFK